MCCCFKLFVHTFSRLQRPHFRVFMACIASWFVWFVITLRVALLASNWAVTLTVDLILSSRSCSRWVLNSFYVALYVFDRSLQRRFLL